MRAAVRACVPSCCRARAPSLLSLPAPSRPRPPTAPPPQRTNLVPCRAARRVAAAERARVVCLRLSLSHTHTHTYGPPSIRRQQFHPPPRSPICRIGDAPPRARARSLRNITCAHTICFPLVPSPWFVALPQGGFAPHYIRARDRRSFLPIAGPPVVFVGPGVAPFLSRVKYDDAFVVLCLVWLFLWD